MYLIRITPLNVNKYIGYDIFFKTGGSYIVKKKLRISSTLKSINIDYPRLNNNLGIITRNIYVII